ncbi:MAG: hypothetical protein HC853_08665 [Anaerolineae bacterium]|nr:hypothetical protein [Anaerolineae bacterium]
MDVRLPHAQPLGFYPPEVVVNDAKRHGMAFLPPCVNKSEWGYVVERDERGGMKDEVGALRMGLQAVAGMGAAMWERIRLAKTFCDLNDFCQRTRLPKALVQNWVRAGLFDVLGERRALLWQLGAIHYVEDGLPMEMLSSQIDLPELSEFESAVWDYELTGLSVAGQFMQHYAPTLQRMGVPTMAQVLAQPKGKKVRVAGMLISLQRPQTARGVTFGTLESSDGLLNLVLKPNVYSRYKPLLRGKDVLLVEGVVQRELEAVSVLVSAMQALTLKP